MELEEISAAKMPKDMKFSAEDIALAMTLTKWVDAKDKDAPHNIGLTLLGVITGYLKGRKDGANSRFYDKYEFCKSEQCPFLYEIGTVDEHCDCGKPSGCLFRAKEYHHWLKENGFLITKVKSGK